MEIETKKDVIEIIESINRQISSKYLKQQILMIKYPFSNKENWQKIQDPKLSENQIYIQ